MARPPHRPQVRTNRRIRFPQVRVIGSDGEQLGVMPTREALRLAEEEGLDLVEISPDARPPVCRILDHGKHLYNESKNAKKGKKRQASTQLKEMRYRPKIDEHDIRFKTERLRTFLKEGHKVRAYVEFRGREMTHTEFGYRILERIKAQLEDVGQPEPSVRMEGRHMSLIINPKKATGQPKSEGKKDSGSKAAKPAGRDKTEKRPPESPAASTDKPAGNRQPVATPVNSGSGENEKAGA